MDMSLRLRSQLFVSMAKWCRSASSCSSVNSRFGGDRAAERLEAGESGGCDRQEPVVDCPRLWPRWRW